MIELGIVDMDATPHTIIDTAVSIDSKATDESGLDLVD
jgi:hypothetical protein